MTTVYRLAVPSPLRRLFDYTPASDENTLTAPQTGTRFEVSFGHQTLMAYLVSIETQSSTDNVLKAVNKRIDTNSIIPQELLALIRWSAHYYQYSLGLCFQTVLPKKLRQGAALENTKTLYQLSHKGKGLAENALKAAKQQQAIIQYLKMHGALSPEELKQQQFKKPALKALIDKALVEALEIDRSQAPAFNNSNITQEPSLILNSEQQTAINSLFKHREGFHCFLLEGITGSGKTEVYLQAIESTLQQGLQVLVLVPEIGLTPQTLSRFEKRFSCPVVAMHSGLNDTQRLKHWTQALYGEAAIVVGTRSAVFTPFKRLGMMIVDEEHDLSYKQQDGFHYHARDVAIRRAHQLNIPIILGSATPSLESLHNAQQQRYHYLQLRERANNAVPPQLELVDLRKQALHSGFSVKLISEIEYALNKNQQVIVFINRRGFAPTVLCHDCGWIAECEQCDTRLTVHKRAGQLRCHHCLFQRPLVSQCPSCHSSKLQALGGGTERSEDFLNAQFPHTRIVRIDRDSTQKKDALINTLNSIEENTAAILIGTQMLAKGHHLPSVTLVAVLNSDALLFANDFRSKERMAQLLTQVGGRAGRETLKGRVLIQTHIPDHPFWQEWLNGGYNTIADNVLQERRAAHMPPFTYLCLLRAEHPHIEQTFEVLKSARRWLEQHFPYLELIGPFPANLMKRANRFRFLLQIKHTQRKELHLATQALIQFLESDKQARKTRWSVDIDPQDCN